MARRDRPEAVPSRPVPPAPPVAEPKAREQRVATKLLLENAIEQPKAVLSATARAHGIASGPVEVEIAVDKKGMVVSARAISGHPLLRDAAVRAARRWKFRPSIVPASAERVVGVIPIQVEP
jgi:protein TonB